MTLDRYMVIMHPLRSLSFRTKTKAISINIVIWICKFTQKIQVDSII